MRPANIVTAVADVLAGVAISGFMTGSGQDWGSVALLCLATIGLYGGGVVFNDVFDAKLDSVERPERPIPSGVVSVTIASILGAALLVMGIVAAGTVSIFPSGLIAAGIALASVVYDKWGKHHSFLGPVNMGLCRGLNLALGISVVPAALDQFGWLALAPIVYIAAITMISRGEVHGGSVKVLYFALIFYTLVIGAILGVAISNQQGLLTSFFVLAFGGMILPPLFTAINDPAGKNIGKAVKAGVIALILMNAAWASAFGVIYLAVGILLLLPVSLVLARVFAVT